VFSTKDGKNYDGQWVDSHMHGDGRYEWTDGSTDRGGWVRAYEGQYVNDLREGHGVFQWRDGRKFEGQWKNGKQHGVGMFKTAEGEARPGEWRDGVRINFKDPKANEGKKSRNSANNVLALPVSPR